MAIAPPVTASAGVLLGAGAWTALTLSALKAALSYSPTLEQISGLQRREFSRTRYAVMNLQATDKNWGCKRLMEKSMSTRGTLRQAYDLKAIKRIQFFARNNVTKKVYKLLI